MDFGHSTATRRRLGGRSPTNAERRTAGGARGNGPPTWTELSFAASESCFPDPHRQHREAHPAPTRDGSSSLQRLRVGELLSRQTVHGAMPLARVAACGTGSCHLCSCALCFVECGIEWSTIASYDAVYHPIPLLPHFPGFFFFFCVGDAVATAPDTHTVSLRLR